MKRKLIYILTFVGLCLFTILSTPVSLAEAPSAPTGNIKITTDIKNNENTNLVDLDSVVTRLAFIEDEAGTKYFCLDADKWYPYGNPYSASEILNNPTTAWLLHNYYYNQQIIENENEETKYAITQLAIWAFTNPEKYGNLAVVQNNQIVLDLIAEANTHEDDLSAEEFMKQISLSLNPLSQKLSLSEDGMNYVAQVEKSFILPPSTVEFSLIEGLYFSYNGMNITNKVNVETIGNLKNISIDKSYLDSIYQQGIPIKIDLTSTLSGSFFVGVAYYTSDSRFQPLGTVENLTLEKNIEASAELLLEKEQPLGSIKLIKKEANSDKRLVGAEFALLDKDKKIIQTLTTDANGEIIFKDVPFGDYFVQETKAPLGYVKDDTLRPVTIDENSLNSTVQLTLDNQKELKLGKIKLVKKEKGSDKRLVGAEFALLDKDKKIIQTLTTDANGEIIFKDVPL
ncbi:MULTISPECIES: thioester domain-containing protein [Vagococcus]|uniref:thioester domain-containing protein n=1 Tax=Vagococcus TaxID=2737 RepID=UPI000B34E94C|nr:MULTISPECIES: thioester domain-containing protein [Vagococcus]HCM90773.1 hypothetical protein [Vagococcus sp.]